MFLPCFTEAACLTAQMPASCIAYGPDRTVSCAPSFHLDFLDFALGAGRELGIQLASAGIALRLGLRPVSPLLILEPIAKKTS
jgi:hypothetical protein